MAPCNRYHLQDVVLGKIYFLLVRIKIKHMEVEIRRRETTGAGASLYNEVCRTSSLRIPVKRTVWRVRYS
jgi:hypothetical protein